MSTSANMGGDRRSNSGDGGTANRATARGTVKTGAAMMAAAVAGLGIHIYTARALQPELYGVLAVVTSIILWWEAAGVALVRQSTERAVAAAGEAWQSVAGASIRTTFLTGLAFAALAWILAPVIADLLDDPGLVPYLRLMVLDIPLYLLLYAWSAVINGRRWYGRRAIATAAYWMAKLILVCGLVALGFSVTGAIIGSIGASVVGLVVAWTLAGVGLPGAGYPAKKLLLFGLPLMALAIADRLTMSMDLWLVKAIVQDADAAGLYGVGKYGFEAAMLLPLAVCGAAFPTLTGAIEHARTESVRELIGESSRFTLLLIAPMIAIMACMGGSIVAVVFGEVYVPAATAIVILLAAAMLAGMRLVANTSLIAASRPGLVLAISAPIVPLNIWLNWMLVSSHGLIGAATATAITFVVASMPAWWFVWRRFRVLPSPLSALRAGIAAGAVYAVGSLTAVEGWLVLFQAAGLVFLYGLLLGALGELKMRDLEPLAFWKK